MTVNDAVAKRVAGLLAEKNMTQYRLEQNSGIQHGHMQWIMSGKSKTVTLSTVMMLANGFGLTIIEFLDDDMFLYVNLEVEKYIRVGYYHYPTAQNMGRVFAPGFSFA